MIAWVVSTEGVLTGLTTATGSQSAFADFGGSIDYGNGGATFFNTAAGADNFSYFSSKDSSGTTSSSFLSSTADISSSFTEYYTILDGTSTSTVTNSGSYYSLFEDVTTESSSGLLETIASQTSTTQTFAANKATTYQTTSSILAWTTSRAQSTDPVNFYQTSSTTNTWSASTQSIQATRDTTTTTNGTMIASATALVVQAKTGGPDEEVIYYASSALSWNGLSAASSVAETATRITLANIYSTIEAPQISHDVSIEVLTFEDENGTTAVSGVGGEIESGVPSFSWSNSSSSYSSQLATSATTSTQTTLVTNSTILPNETSATTTQAAKTSTISFSSILWTSNSGSCSAQDSTTTSFQEIATSSTAAGSSWLGSLSWNVARTTTVSRAITTSTTAGYIRGMTNNTGPEPNFAVAWGHSEESGITASQNMLLVLPPQVTTALAQNVSQSKFVPVFAQIASSRGQWFTVANSTFSSASFASVSRSLGKTIFPLTTTSESSGESYGLSRLTYVSGTGEQATTTTAALGVQGQSTTIAIPASPIGIVGGSPNLSETFAYGVGAAGVYKNRIGGGTTSFDAGATTFSQSQPASFFEPITALVPVVGTGTTAVFPLYWAVPRNSTALPPAMPPNT